MICLRCEASQKMLRKQARQAYDQQKRIELLVIQVREATKHNKLLERQLAHKIAELDRVKSAVKILERVA